MMNINDLLGLDAERLNWYQMMMRATIVFMLALIYVRIAGLRTFGKMSSFDQITSLIFGAIMGRAIVSDQPFFESMAAALLIMLLHRTAAYLTFRSSKAGKLIKGEMLLLYKDGAMIRQNLQRVHVSERDIMEALYLKLNTKDLNEVSEIYMGRSGEICLIRKKQSV
jgi:uncharacterized membrane protein YcaP (DUF421 family)